MGSGKDELVKCLFGLWPAVSPSRCASAGSRWTSAARSRRSTTAPGSAQPALSDSTRFVDLTVFSIPSYVLVYVLVAVVCELLLSRTTYGRKLRLIGVNREAALVGGINVRRVTTTAFVISSTLAALAAIIQGARLLQGSTNTGDGLEFDALTALLIGGVSLGGGKGSILNAMIGVLLLAVIINALTHAERALRMAQHRQGDPDPDRGQHGRAGEEEK